jgi:hypothetical protein
MKKIIIGTGAGRCGTQSLARLLELQPGVSATHEAFVLPWMYRGKEMRAAIENLENRPGKIAVDVAHYWTNYVDELIGTGVDVRVIGLIRDPDEITKSFLSKTKEKNHWKHNINPELWDRTMPKYPGVVSKEVAINFYVREQQHKIKMLKNEHQSHVFLIETEELNDEKTMKGIMKWAGIDEPRYELIHLNKNKE